jgi:hypothetical protein
MRLQDALGLIVRPFSPRNHLAWGVVSFDEATMLLGIIYDDSADIGAILHDASNGSAY